MAEELKEQFPFLYKKQARREQALNLPIHIMFDVKQNKIQLEQEVNTGTIEPSVTIGAEMNNLFSPREEAVKFVLRQEVAVKRAVDPKSGDRTPPKKKRFVLNARQEIDPNDVLGQEEFEFYKELQIKKEMDHLGRFNVHGRTVFYARNSLYLMKETSEFRKILVWIIEWKWFERFILGCIGVNSIVLLLFDYEDRDSLTIQNQIINYISDALTVIFFVEAGLKIAAFGFIMHRYAYMRDAWNVADFVIVITGIIDLMRVKLNLKALRILRVIRPLRSIKAIPSMRKLVSTLLKSLPELGNATIFIAFMIMLFSILGLQQFEGVTYYRCRLTEKPVNETYWPRSSIYTRVCSPVPGVGAYSCPEDMWCGSPLDHGISLENDNVYNDPVVQFGINSFENFGAAIIVVLQTITAENWSPIMYNVSDGYTPFFTYIYFCLIVIIGYYYMMQLLLAVIMSNLAKIMAQEEHDEIHRKKRLVKQDKENKRKLHQQEMKKQQEEKESNQFHLTPPMIVNVLPAASVDDRDPSGIKTLGNKGDGQGFTNMVINSQGDAKTISSDVSNSRTSLYANKGSRVDQNSNKRGAPQPPRGQGQDIQEDTLELEDGGKNFRMTSQYDTSGVGVIEGGKRVSTSQIPLKIYQEIPINYSAQQQQKKGSHPKIKNQVHNEEQSPQNMIRSETQKTEDRKLDEVIKGMFMWNLGGNYGDSMDLSQGIGLAILSQVIGVKELEADYQATIERLHDILKHPDLEQRLAEAMELESDFARQSRKMDLIVARKYQASRKIVYGIENEIHLVEQVQKTLSNMQKLSPDDITVPYLIEQILGLQIKPRKSIQDIILEATNNPKELSLSDQLNVSLKVAQHLREVAKQQKAREFFFVRFKRQLYKKNLIDRFRDKVASKIIQTRLEIRSRKSMFYKFCYIISESIFFQIFSFIVILANSIVLSLSKYPEDGILESKIETFNLAFFCFFMFELLVKIGGQGFKMYFEDQFNWFDFTVLVISSIDIAFQYTLNLSESGSGAITALRVFRLIRVFRLAKVWKDFQELLIAISNTVKDISNISVLLLIFIYTFMLIGMELYAYKVKFNRETYNIDMINGEYPHSNFNSALESFLSVFIVLSNDGWATLFYDYYRSGNQVVATIYFMSLLMFGQFIMINLFIAVLIQNFDQLSIRKDMINKIHKIRERPFLKRLFASCSDDKNEKQMTNVIDELINGDLQEKKRLADVEQQQQNSLFCITYESKLRKVSQKIVTHKFFERTMLIIIFVTTIQLAIDNPLSDPSSFIQKFLFILDICLTIIFIAEAGLKIITYGFAFCGSTSYIRNSWNILDLGIVIISVASLMLPTTNLNSIKAIRLMKILRPLRVISRNQGLKISIRTLGVALPGIINVILVTIIFLFICGIIGVNYFKGRFFDCESDFEVLGYALSKTLQGVDDKWECINYGGEWVKDFLNFDNISSAMKSFFVITTSVEWSDIMYTAASIRGYDLTHSQKIEWPLAAIFFVIVVVIGNFFLMNLFVGVIISTYNREKELAGKDFMKSEDQKKNQSNSLMFLNTKPQHRMQIPFNGFQLPFYYIAENVLLQYFIQLCIVVNTICMTFQWPNMSDELKNFLDTINLVFVFIFTGEFLIKIIGYGKRYFKDSWNIFDMIIVMLTLISIIYGSVSSNTQLGPQTTVIRSFRIARIFYFFKRNKALKGTFQTFIGCLPAIANIGSLILLTMLIYSILGVYLFSEVKWNGVLTADTNFTSVGNAFLLLVRITSGERWPQLMEAVSRENGMKFSCVTNPSFEDYVNNDYKPVGCGVQGFAVVYFFSYNLIICMVFLRLFIAIILQTFKDITEKDNKFINQDLSDHFRHIWAIYDPDASSFLKKTVYSKFLIALGNPLGWDLTFEHNFIKQQQYLSETKLPLANKNAYYKFIDVLEHLILLMIIRREVVHFGIKNNQLTLLNYFDQENKIINTIHEETIEKVRNQEVIEKDVETAVDEPLLKTRADMEEAEKNKIQTNIQLLNQKLVAMNMNPLDEHAISIIINEKMNPGSLNKKGALPVSNILGQSLNALNADGDVVIPEIRTAVAGINDDAFAVSSGQVSQKASTMEAAIFEQGRFVPLPRKSQYGGGIKLPIPTNQSNTARNQQVQQVVTRYENQAAALNKKTSQVSSSMINFKATKANVIGGGGGGGNTSKTQMNQSDTGSNISRVILQNQMMYNSLEDPMSYMNGANLTGMNNSLSQFNSNKPSVENVYRQGSLEQIPLIQVQAARASVYDNRYPEESSTAQVPIQQSSIIVPAKNIAPQQPPVALPLKQKKSIDPPSPVQLHQKQQVSISSPATIFTPVIKEQDSFPQSSHQLVIGGVPPRSRLTQIENIASEESKSLLYIQKKKTLMKTMKEPNTSGTNSVTGAVGAQSSKHSQNQEKMPLLDEAVEQMIQESRPPITEYEEASEYGEEYEEEVDEEMARVFHPHMQGAAHGATVAKEQGKKLEELKVNDELMDLVEEELSRYKNLDQSGSLPDIDSNSLEIQWESKKDR